MKTTTTYTERKTITTDDAGNTTITTSHSAHTLTEYYFDELTPEAQQRAIRDAIEEEQDAYYSSSWDYASHTGTSISEVWDAYKALAYDQPVRYNDHYTSFFLTVGDYEHVTHEDDTGICWSMDICDAWNKYADAVPLLLEEAEDHEATADEIAAPYYWPYCVADQEPPSVLVWGKAHDEYAEKCREKAEELAEEAKDAIESTIKELIADLESYYASPEFWAEWLSGSYARYTRDGTRI